MKTFKESEEMYQLRFVEGVPVAEIARRFGISPCSVYDRTNRWCRNRLRIKFNPPIKGGKIIVNRVKQKAIAPNAKIS